MTTEFHNFDNVKTEFGADNLDSERWESRDLTDYGTINCSIYVDLSFECATCL